MGTQSLPTLWKSEHIALFDSLRSKFLKTTATLPPEFHHYTMRMVYLGLFEQANCERAIVLFLDDAEERLEVGLALCERNYSGSKLRKLIFGTGETRDEHR